MKGFTRFISAIVTGSAFLMLTGCGGQATASTGTALPVGTEATSQYSKTVQQAAENSNGNSGENSGEHSLVVYFSWSGNTQQMAQWIADEKGSDIYRVTPKEAYGPDFESCSDRAKNELDNGIRPELAELMEAQTMAQYDTIYVGFPIWWYDLPMAMTAFLENYDLSGKTVIPFFTHNGSSSGASAPETLKKICVGANVLAEEALSVSGDSVENSETQIREWASRLKK